MGDNLGSENPDLSLTEKAPPIVTANVLFSFSVNTPRPSDPELAHRYTLKFRLWPFAERKYRLGMYIQDVAKTRTVKCLIA